MDEKEWKKLFKKHRIKSAKYGGDDCYSWAVFRNGSPVITGISKRCVPYYMRQIVQNLEGKENHNEKGREESGKESREKE